jgi:hypothetical protein
MPNIDSSLWPLWVVIIFQFLLTFKKEIISAFKLVVRAKEDQQEHDQGIEENLVQSRLDLLEREFSKKEKHETELQALLKAQTDLIGKLVSNELQVLNTKADETNAAIKAQRQALLRLTDMIALLYSRSLKQNGEVIQNVVDEIEGILDGDPSPAGNTSISEG